MKNKSLKKFLSLILTFTFVFGMLTGEFTARAAVTVNTDTSISNYNAVYVALGDSVPAGYGLSNADDCYVKLFSNKMTENGYSNAMLNYAVSGITTNTLLTGLQNMQTTSPEALATIISANVITVNIGGNNVLGPMVKAVNEKLSQQLEALGIANITQATSAQLVSVGSALSLMTFDDAQLEQIMLGAESFATDLPKIVAWLKTTAPNADIIVSTIYNPIPSNMSLYQTSEKLLQGMNKMITDRALQGGYYVADVYSAFSKAQAQKIQLINLNLGQYATSPLSIDIHPTAAGHELIAEVHNDVFQTIPRIADTALGTPVTASLSLSGEVDTKGVLTVDITEQLLKSVIEKAQSKATQSARDKDGIAVIFENTAEKVKSMKVNFDAAALDLLKSSEVKKITVSTDIFCFSLDKEAIKKIESKTKTKVTVKVTPITKLSTAAKKLIGSRPVYKTSITDASGNKISNLGKGSITFNMYYKASAKEKAGSLFAVYINSKEQPKLLTDSSYLDRWVTYTSNIIGTYGIAYKK